MVTLVSPFENLVTCKREKGEREVSGGEKREGDRE
jgi:hypothetical protein